MWSNGRRGSGSERKRVISLQPRHPKEERGTGVRVSHCSLRQHGPGEQITWSSASSKETGHSDIWARTCWVSWAETASWYCCQNARGLKDGAQTPGRASHERHSEVFAKGSTPCRHIRTTSGGKENGNAAGVAAEGIGRESISRSIRRSNRVISERPVDARTLTDVKCWWGEEESSCCWRKQAHRGPHWRRSGWAAFGFLAKERNAEKASSGVKEKGCQRSFRRSCQKEKSWSIESTARCWTRFNGRRTRGRRILQTRFPW